MQKKIKVELGDIEKTLFMPVWARAMETQKKNPVLADKTAVKIMNSVDYDFETMSKNVPEISQIAWIARCKRFDMIINEFINRHHDAAIVNIGCGLDTTYERINNSSVFWYDLDLPGVIELRKKFLYESEKRKFISASFLDTTWLDLIPKKNVLFAATGVFMYFEEAEIKDFLIQVATTFPGSELFFDVTSPKGIKVANEVIRKSGMSPDSFFKWGIKDKAIIPSWDDGIILNNSFYTFKIKGLHLRIRNRIIGFISDFLDIQYMLHLKIRK